MQIDFSVIHQTYCRLSGMEIALTMGRTYAWEVWSSKGWTATDLTLVVSRLKQLIREKRKWESSLHFRRLIEDLDGFEEILSEARALARVPQRTITDRDRVLQASGRKATEVQLAARTPAQIMAGDEAFRKLRELGASL